MQRGGIQGVVWGRQLTQSRFVTHQELLAGVELSAQLTAKLTVGQLEILPQVSAVGHQGQETVIADVGQLIVLTLHVWHIHVVGRRTDILVSRVERYGKCEQL